MTTQLDRIEQKLDRLLAAAATISAKETVIVSQQDEVNQDVAELTADLANFQKFRTDVEAFIAANPNLNLADLQAIVGQVHTEATAQQADDASVQPPAPPAS